jgi:putative ABC transport system permease protein
MVGVGISYFDTIGVGMIRGRGLTEVDEGAGHIGAVINERLAAMYFPAADPIGAQITLTDPAPAVQQDAPAVATIVGIVTNIRQNTDALPSPVVYLPYEADPQRYMVLMVRSSDASVASIVRNEMRVVEPDVPLYDIETLDDVLAQPRWPFRVYGSMFAIFAAIATAMSAVGLYAVTAYAVTQRTPEIGVRIALGAQTSRVLWLVLRRGVGQLAIALPIGMAGAFGVARLLQGFLAGTNGGDPIVVVGIAGVVVAISIAACLLPAWRATRIEPLSALRHE